MKFEFIKLDHLPRLSWCAQLRKDREVVEVFHGPWVETGENWFVEGAWDGEFDKHSFVTSEAFAGSGAQVVENGVLFSTPFHTLDRLHIVHAQNSITVSNSLVFALEQSHTELDDAYPWYLADFRSISLGLRRCIRDIKVKPVGRLTLHYHQNIFVTETLDVIEGGKRESDPFPTFQSYYDFLHKKVSAICLNAGSKSRQISYDPVTTVSNGYDSVVCAVLAKMVGCRDAVTVRDARASKLDRAEQGVDDSGSDIARRLGMNCVEIGRRDYLESKTLDEAEFYSTGWRGGEMVFVPLEEALEGKILFTGYYGGRVWDRNQHKVSPHIEGGDGSGTSFTDYRLRVGFVHLPVPYLGCTALPSIHAISNSIEMKSWSLNKRYDRPIPRRIIEASNIPRTLFGQVKKSVNPLLWRGLKGRWREDARSDYLSYLGMNGILKSKAYAFLFNKLYLLYKVRNRLFRLIEKKRPYSVPLFRILDYYSFPMGEDMFCIQWAVRRLRSRYKVDV